MSVVCLEQQRPFEIGLIPGDDDDDDANRSEKPESCKYSSRYTLAVGPIVCLWLATTRALVKLGWKLSEARRLN